MQNHNKKRKWEITYEYLFVAFDDVEKFFKDSDGDLDDMVLEADQEVTEFEGTKEECFDYLIEILKENVDFKISSIVDITDEEEPIGDAGLWTPQEEM